jgi:hypothetical protein
VGCERQEEVGRDEASPLGKVRGSRVWGLGFRVCDEASPLGKVRGFGVYGLGFRVCDEASPLGKVRYFQTPESRIDSIRNSLETLNSRHRNPKLHAGTLLPRRYWTCATAFQAGLHPKP